MNIIPLRSRGNFISLSKGHITGEIIHVGRGVQQLLNAIGMAATPHRSRYPGAFQILWCHPTQPVVRLVRLFSYKTLLVRGGVSAVMSRGYEVAE